MWFKDLPELWDGLGGSIRNLPRWVVPILDTRAHCQLGSGAPKVTQGPAGCTGAWWWVGELRPCVGDVWTGSSQPGNVGATGKVARCFRRGSFIVPNVASWRPGHGTVVPGRGGGQRPCACFGSTRSPQPRHAGAAEKLSRVFRRGSVEEPAARLNTGHGAVVRESSAGHRPCTRVEWSE